MGGGGGVKRSIQVLIIFILVLPSFTIFEGDSWASEDQVISNTQNSDYPQQDGGSDDRLFQYRSMWMDGYQIVNISDPENPDSINGYHWQNTPTAFSVNSNTCAIASDEGIEVVNLIYPDGSPQGVALIEPKPPRTVDWP